MIHYAFPPDPMETHSVIETEALPLSEETIARSLNRSPPMPNRRFDWHEHIKDVHGEYKAARIAIDRLKVAVVEVPDLYRLDPDAIVIVTVFAKAAQQTPKRVINDCQRRLRAYDEAVNKARREGG